MQEALDHLLGRPVGERRADGACAVKTQGARAGQLHRTPHPPAAPGGAGQRIAPVIAAVDQNARVALQVVATLDLLGCAHQQFFQCRYARFGGSAGARQIQKLAAVVKSHDAQIAPLRPRDRYAVQLRQRLVRVHLRVAAAAKPVFQFCWGGHGRRAGMARDHDGTAGVGHARGVRPAFALQQAAQQARQKCIARTQHIEHFHAFALEGGRVVNLRGYRAFNHGATQSPAFDHQRRSAERAHCAQAGHQVSGYATGNEKLFLGADQQIELRQHLLQLRGDVRVGHITVLTRAARGQPPEHRAVIDVEHAHHAVARRVAQGLLRCGAGTGCGQVCAGDGQRAAAGDKTFVDGVGVDRHIRAVFAHE